MINHQKRKSRKDVNPQTVIVVPLMILTATILSLSALEPICSMNDWQHTAHIVNWPITLICHQSSNRCLEIFGFRLSICARCFAFYSAVFLCSSWYLCFSLPKKILNFKIFILFIAPLVLDGTTQLLELRTSTNILRVITGTAAGFGTTLVILPFLGSKFRPTDFKSQ